MIHKNDLWNWTTIFNEFDHMFEGLPIKREQVIKSTTESYHAEADDKELRLLVDVPGIKAEDLDVSVTDRIVTIVGKLRSREIVHKYVITEGFDVTKNIQASLADGVLTLSFLREKQVQPRKIVIEVK